ncbi:MULTISPECIES: hypothetical protein [unclassified Pseudoxanthomonas]|jgi:hypothetical protein|uniref:hypothetical protein n=1 Tax=unclassified Pseudoxanthomonas TaxID=2645906 RepID=UPI00307D26DF
MTSPRLLHRSSFQAFLLTGAAFALSSCVSTPGPQVEGGGRCSDSALGWATGQPADEATLKRLSRESGAGLVNPIGPKTVVKHDARNDRLRVYLDADNRITAARCE